MTYFLFGYDDYYPSGGMHDCKGVFSADSDAQAIAEAARRLVASGFSENMNLYRLTNDGYVAIDHDFYPLIEQTRGTP